MPAMRESAMKIELVVTTDNGVASRVTIEASPRAYAYIQNVLTNAMIEVFREEANGLPHAGKP